MATAADLYKVGTLEKVDPNDILETWEQPHRAIYLTPRAGKWLEDDLTALKTDGVISGANSPKDQVYDLFYNFISGTNLAQDSWFPKPLRRSQKSVWELRTPDLRLFGWFWRKGIFVISAINTATNIKDSDLYEGYKDQCVFDRSKLDLDPPKYISGSIVDVL